MRHLCDVFCSNVTFFVTCYLLANAYILYKSIPCNPGTAFAYILCAGSLRPGVLVGCTGYAYIGEVMGLVGECLLTSFYNPCNFSPVIENNA